MKAIYSAETNEFAQTKPPSGREGDHGSGGRRARDFGISLIKFRTIYKYPDRY